MSNKRNRQKLRNSGKTLEGYEKHLLQEVDKWHRVAEENPGMAVERDARYEANKFRAMHGHIRRFYFNL